MNFYILNSKAYWVVISISPRILNIGPTERWFASRLGRFILRHTDRGWVEPRASLNAVHDPFPIPQPSIPVTTSYPRCAGGIALLTCSSSNWDTHIMKTPVTQLRRLVAGLWQRRFQFDHRAVHVGFTVDKVALRVFIQALQFFAAGIFYQSSIPFYPLPTLHSLSNRQVVKNSTYNTMTIHTMAL